MTASRFFQGIPVRVQISPALRFRYELNLIVTRRLSPIVASNRLNMSSRPVGLEREVREENRDLSSCRIFAVRSVRDVVHQLFVITEVGTESIGRGVGRVRGAQHLPPAEDGVFAREHDGNRPARYAVGQGRKIGLLGVFTI